MQRVLGLIGLCMRAGRLVTGLDAAEVAAKRGGAQLLLLDGGASANARKAIEDAGRYAGVRVRDLPEGALGAATGKDGRMAAAVVDRGFADKIVERLDQQRDCGGACRE